MRNNFSCLFFTVLLCIGLTSCSEVKQTQQRTDNSLLPWNNKQAAVVLTYDDGLNVHLTNAIPALNSLGLKGTFYIADFGHLKTQIPGWKAASLKGHELANHTLYHPCTGGPGRTFVTPAHDLRYYSLSRITDEIKAMNTILNAIDGKTTRTFAFPCGDTRIRDTPYLDGAKNEFIAARAVRSQMPTIDEVQLFNVPAYMVNGETGDKLIELVKDAKSRKALLVFLFHGVGGEHGLNVSLEAHTALLRFLKKNEKELWIAPMAEVAGYVNKRRSLQNMRNSHPIPKARS
jgi:peptidoglycan/xylan/chitin deacetylase (PgdA/CDA1 family)